MLPNLPFIFWSLLITGICVGFYFLFRGTVTAFGGKLIAPYDILKLSNKFFYASIVLVLFNLVYGYFRYMYNPNTSDLIGYLW